MEGLRENCLRANAALESAKSASQETAALQKAEDEARQAAALARENLAENGLKGQILTCDLRAMSLDKPMDLVISNPPWYPQGSGKEGGPGRMEDCTLPQLCTAAAGTLKPKGRFALVHRPERLTDLLCALRGAGLEPKRLRLCRHSPDKPPYAVLIEAVKGGHPGLDILPDLI